MTRDEYGLQLAKTASLKSKDPSTKVGCALIRQDGTVAGLGYNGTSRGVDDAYWVKGPRDRKLAVTLHAELNACLNSQGSLDGCTAYIYPLPSCSHCSAVLAQCGVSRVVAMGPDRDSAWIESAMMGRQLLEESGAEVVWLSA